MNNHTVDLLGGGGGRSEILSSTGDGRSVTRGQKVGVPNFRVRYALPRVLASPDRSISVISRIFTAQI